uniref:(northern house mosquito) hypothetical protein n=1 Tax=Culex pipiens TaxID=7175 RepID=A0A8D8ACU8_CULPI
MVRLREPGGVVVQSEWCPVGGVVPLEVLHDHLLHVLGVRRVRAGVAHRAAATVQVLPHHHRDLPNTWITLGRAGRNHTVVEDLVVQRVRPAWRTVLVHRHGRVVREVEVVQHLEHLVASDGQERSAHSTHVVQLDATVRGQDLTLAGNFTGPLFRRESLTEAMRNGVGCHLVSIGVQVLHLAVVGPLVRHVEGSGDGASVRVHAAALEQVLVQLFVQVVDGVVEGEQHNLGHLLDGQIAGNVLSAAVAIGQLAHVLAALGGRLVRGWLRVQGFWAGRQIVVDVDELLRLRDNRLGWLQRWAGARWMSSSVGRDRRLGIGVVL